MIKNLSISYSQIDTKLMGCIRDPRSGIRQTSIPDPDPEVNKALDPRSATLQKPKGISLRKIFKKQVPGTFSIACCNNNKEQMAQGPSSKVKRLIRFCFEYVIYEIIALMTQFGRYFYFYIYFFCGLESLRFDF